MGDVTEISGQGSRIRLVILVPSIEYWHADFALSLYGLHQYLMLHKPCDDFQFNLVNERGSLIANSRENLAKKFVEGDYTHALWLDCDMTFPPSLFHRLHHNDLPLVACNYVKRTIPAMPNSKNLDGKLLATNRDSHGLEEASSAGFGCVLMKREVFDKIDRPYFDTVWYYKDDEAEEANEPEMMGEDVFFFKKARHYGFPLFIDHDASQHIGHVGTFEYQNALCEATWDELDEDEVKAKVMGDAV